MAGEWIKMGVGLRTHPKVVRIASALKADRLRVIGGLHGVWSIFDGHSADGFLEGYTPEAIDEELGWRGFARAMEAVGWLIVESDGLHVPDYEDHNGPTAKRRAMETRRKNESREGTKASRLSASRADKKLAESGQVSASHADSLRAREEKKREETPKPVLTTPSQDSSTGGPVAPAGVVPAEAEPRHPKPGNIAAGLSLDALRTAPAVGTPEASKTGELWAVLAANGCRGTAQHPTVIEMARAGVTVAELRAAIAEARKSQEGPLNPPYLAAIVERMRAGGAKPRGKAAAWATDDAALEAKARELGLWPTKAASYHELRALVRSRLDQQAAETVR